MSNLLTLLGGARGKSLYHASFLQSLPAGFTHTRSTGNAAYIGADGNYHLANANEPRFDYDPVTGLPKGYLNEPRRTNFQERSAFTSGWNSNSSGTLGATVDMLGQAGRSLSFIDNTYSGIYRNATIDETGVPCTMSCFFKKISGSPVVRFGSDRPIWGSGSQYAYATVNLDTHEIVNSSGSLDIKVEDFGGGVKRVSITSVVHDTLVNNFIFRGGSVGAGEIAVWGCQTEKGNFATSPIPTDGTTVTRGADGLYASNPSWLSQDEGVLMLDLAPIGFEGDEFPQLFELSNGSGSGERLFSYVNEVAGNKPSLKMYKDSVMQFDTSGSIALAAGQRSRIAVQYKANDCLYAIDGSTNLTDSSASNMPIMSRLDLLRSSSGGLTAASHLRSLQFWNSGMSAQELERITR